MLGTEELIEQRKHGEQRREQGGGDGGKLKKTREEMGGEMGRGVSDNVYKRINSSLGGNVFNTFIPYYEMYNIRVS